MKILASFTVLLVMLTYCACTSVSRSTLTDWARLVNARPTHVIPHLIIVGDEYSAIEVRRDNQWVEVLQSTFLTVYVLKDRQQILVNHGSKTGGKLALIMKSGNVAWQRDLEEGTDALPRLDRKGVTLVNYSPGKFRVTELDLGGKSLAEREIPGETSPCNEFVGFQDARPVLWCGKNYLVLADDSTELLTYGQARENPIVRPDYYGHSRDDAFRYFLSNDRTSDGTTKLQ